MMTEFAEHYRQKRFRHVPLCEHCVSLLPKSRQTMVNIKGLGSECVWCGIHDYRHVEASYLVDRRTVTCP